MKILIAPQAFKGSISALKVAKAIEKGVLEILPNAETILMPVADGGDGTLETLVETSNGTIMSCEVTNPIGGKIQAEWGAMGDGSTAIIEMARTSGLTLINPDQRNPLLTTTYGLGEIIRNAMDSGFRKFIVGIGGSATNDAGSGMAQALGIQLLDSNGQNIEIGGSALASLDKIDVSKADKRLKESDFLVACDVNNPLTGTEGASAVYGPQKGATPKMVTRLDAALLHFANVVKRDLGTEINNIPGAGAAGGLGGGFIAFLNGKLRTGVDIVLDTIGIDEHLKNVSLVITGEGQMDFQTIYDKAPIGVARRAKVRGIPVIGISGSLGKNFTDVHRHGIDAASAITIAPMSLEEASQKAPDLITSVTVQSLRLMKLGADVFC